MKFDGEYQRVKIRWQSRWRDSKTLLDAIPSHAPDCGCSECPDEPMVNVITAEHMASLQPATRCKACKKPFSPPIGLFGTNDVPCPHCKACYSVEHNE